MIEQEYNKLVRDNIPYIIAENEKGKYIVFKSYENDEEFMKALEAKLDEEVKEFHESKTVEELADILDVVYTIARHMGTHPTPLNDKVYEKRNKRGGFDKRICLKAVISMEEE